MARTIVHLTTDHTLSMVERPTPASKSQAGHELHVIEVHTTSFTNGELLWPEVNELPEPVPGFDVAGVIVASPAGSQFKTGDAVYGYTSVTRPGAAREYQVASDSELAIKPERLSWEEAATVPLSALTAWQALFEHARLPMPNAISSTTSSNEKNVANARVLITAASGGVGVWAVQLAHLAGAYVVATCGPRNIDFVKHLGADEVLDYTSTPVSTWTAADSDRKFDIVIDCKGGTTLQEAWMCVRTGGFMNSVAQPPDDLKPDGVANDVTSKWFIVEPNGAQLRKISELIENGTCCATVDSVHDFDHWKDAFERLDSGHARGKVVLRVKA